MKRHIARTRGSTVIVVTAAILTAMFMLTIPLTFSLYSAAATGVAQARVAAWDPKATASPPRKIIFRDTSTSNYSLDAADVTLDNRLSEVRARYTLLQPKLQTGPLANAMYAHSALTMPAATEVNPGAQSTVTIPMSTWMRWYINDEKIDITKANDGLVWEQDFTGQSSVAAAIPFRFVYPLEGQGDLGGDSSTYKTATIESGSVTGVTMTGNYLHMGSRHKNPVRVDGRFAMFDKPTGVGDNWAIEFDACFGWRSTGFSVANNPLFALVIWDSASDPALKTTSPDWYAIGLAMEKETLKANDSNTDLGVFCMKGVGINDVGGPNNSTWEHLAPPRSWGKNFVEGQVFHMRIERFGSRITMYIEGEQVLHFTRLSASGNERLAFYASECYAGVDNIKFYAMVTPDGFNSDPEVMPPSDTGMYKRVVWEYDAVQVD